MEDFELIDGSCLAAMLWQWRRTGPEAPKATQRSGPSEWVIAAMAGSAILG